ncbi:MAG: hypothetical protein PHG66_01635, partial [Candidatus Colwellbacteria bacterium]|nr:hypothetical protein [Candidatus Colwellbacteria bacterium]
MSDYQTLKKRDFKSQSSKFSMTPITDIYTNSGSLPPNTISFFSNCNNAVSSQAGDNFAIDNVPPNTDPTYGNYQQYSIITKLKFYVSTTSEKSFQVLNTVTFCNYDKLSTQGTSSTTLTVNYGNTNRCSGPPCNHNNGDNPWIAPDTVQLLPGFGITGIDVYQTDMNIRGMVFRYSHLYSTGISARQADVFITLGDTSVSLCKRSYYPPSNKYFLNQISFSTSSSDNSSEVYDGLLRVTNTKWLNLTPVIDNYYDPIFIAKCCNNPFLANTIEDTICGLLPSDTNGTSCAIAKANAAIALQKSTGGATYIGCFKDSANPRPIPNLKGEGFTISACNDLANAAGSPYFGIQWWEGQGSSIGTLGECLIGDSSLTLSQAQSQGPVTTCDKGTDGNMYGEASTNAIYSSSSGGTSGGTPSGGTPSGGTPSGGTPSGGTPSGGTPSGGTPSGGTPSGGTPSG